MAGAAVIGLVASGCGSRPGAAEAGEAADAGGVVNMVMAPDPVWKWIEDNGIKQEMEEEAGIQILTSSSWDEFGVYAGGHADVISAASYEVPELAERRPASRPPCFGKYNTDRSIVAVAADSDAQDICDLEGKKIVTYTAVSHHADLGRCTRKEHCGLDLRAGGGDFELVVTDIAEPGEPGRARRRRRLPAACPTSPSPSCPAVELKPLYDSKSALPRSGRRTSLPTPRTPRTRRPTCSSPARPGWRRTPEEATFLIELWDRGIQEWQEHRDEIIAAYPEDFAVRTPEEMAFIAGLAGQQVRLVRRHDLPRRRVGRGRDARSST